MQAAAGQFGNAANLGLAGSAASIAADPYYRALQPGLQAAGSTQASMGNMIGSTYNNATQMGFGAATFNANMMDSRYNSFMNNQAAMNAARMGAGASQNAATMGMIGSGVGAAASIGIAI
jgi:hypothetical protein